MRRIERPLSRYRCVHVPFTWNCFAGILIIFTFVHVFISQATRKQIHSVKMIIPSLYLKEGTLVDPRNGQNVQDVPGCLGAISLCSEFTIVYLDKEKETKEFGMSLVDITSCGVQCETYNEDEVLDLLDNGANRVILNKDQLREFGQFMPKERISCKLSDAEPSGIEELTKEINNLKERSSSFLLPYKKDSQVDEASLVEFTKELKTSLCDDVRLIISVYEVISYPTIAQLHSLGVQVQLSATWLLNELSLGQIIASCLKSDRPDGLFPTLVVSDA